jgi:hypothetical protein
MKLPSLHAKVNAAHATLMLKPQLEESKEKDILILMEAFV